MLRFLFVAVLVAFGGVAFGQGSPEQDALTARDQMESDRTDALCFYDDAVAKRTQAWTLYDQVYNNLTSQQRVVFEGYSSNGDADLTSGNTAYNAAQTNRQYGYDALAEAYAYQEAEDQESADAWFVTAKIKFQLARTDYVDAGDEYSTAAFWFYTGYLYIGGT